MNVKKRAGDIIELALSDMGRQHSIMWEFAAGEFGWLSVDFWIDMTMEEEGYILYGTEGEVRISKEEVSPYWFTIATRPRVPWCGHRTGPLTPEDIRNVVKEAVEALDKQVAARRELLSDVVKRDREASLRMD